MSHKGQIILVLAGCLFIAGGVFPWASATIGSTVESFKGANESLLYLTGGLFLAASLIISGKISKTIPLAASLIGLGWGVYLGFLLVSYFLNPPQFTQSSNSLIFGPGLFLTLCASILSAGYGLFHLKFSASPLTIS